MLRWPERAGVRLRGSFFRQGFVQKASSLLLECWRHLRHLQVPLCLPQVVHWSGTVWPRWTHMRQLRQRGLPSSSGINSMLWPVEASALLVRLSARVEAIHLRFSPRRRSVALMSASTRGTCGVVSRMAASRAASRRQTLRCLSSLARRFVSWHLVPARSLKCSAA